VKARSALEGRSVRAVVVELFRRWLGEAPEEDPEAERRERLRRYCGIVDSGVTDLATNPAYLEGFGDDAARDR